MLVVEENVLLFFDIFKHNRLLLLQFQQAQSLDLLSPKINLHTFKLIPNRNPNYFPLILLLLLIFFPLLTLTTFLITTTINLLLRYIINNAYNIYIINFRRLILMLPMIVRFCIFLGYTWLGCLDYFVLFVF